MKVVLAEKPSVARDIASFLGANSRHEGYYEGRGYQVTWAFGHLVTLKEPAEYDPALKRWSLETLPFVPERFELKLMDDNRGGRKQFGAIKRLFQGADELICATDAGREGELIFRYILLMTGCSKKPFQRLWLSSLTEEAIRDAFNNLRSGRDYDTLYAAAKCRQESDWIVGLNATRNFTVRYGAHGLLWSVGRVQTPVLAMIVRRDDEIRNFKPEPFWELSTRYREVIFKFRGERFKKEEEAKALLAKVEGHPFVIEKVESKKQKVQPPLLYDLTELQRDMNRRYGMSADDTLKLAQSLYENKTITYPRTDSRYLGSDMKEKIPDILENLKDIKETEISPLKLDALPFTARITNDKKVTDHHAIIPTGKISRSLSLDEQKVYDAVVTRLIAVFYPPCLKEITTVDGVSNTVPFRARGVRILDPGWTVLYPTKSKADDQQEEDGEEEQELPSFKPGERGPHQPFIKKGMTKPPKHFTENSLLGAMETAGRLVDDESLKEALKEKGLGTPATRAAIIETLLKRRYIVRKKKTLTATDLGRYLVALVQDANLKSAELTGEWEAKLKQIESGQLAPEQFMREIVQFTDDVIRESGMSAVDGSRFGDCPRCGAPVIEGRQGYGCSGWKKGCQFVLWKEYKGIHLNVGAIRQLIQRRILMEPVTLPDIGPVVLCLSDAGHVMDIPVPTPDQQQRTPPRRGRGNQSAASRPKAKTGKGRRPPADGAAIGTCPLCSKPVVEQEKSFNCVGWQSGCKFTVWKTIAGKRIQTRTVKKLLSEGKTSVLKGFKSKSGKSFEAGLKLENGEVRLDFKDK